MKDFVTYADIEEFTRMLSILNIHLKSVEFNQESVEVQLHGQVHQVAGPGQNEMEMTMIASPLSVNTFMQLVREVENLELIRKSSHPAVRDQYEKLIEIAALAKGDDSACDPG